MIGRWEKIAFSITMYRNMQIIAGFERIYDVLDEDI